MKVFLSVLFSTLLVAALGGCSVPTRINSETAAASEVANSKVINSPMMIDYAFQPADLDITVNPIGNTGSACSFPLALSQAFYSTFDAVNHQAFRNIVGPNSRGAYRVRFELNSFDNSLVFASRFFGTTAVAHSDLTLRVSVIDPTGNEITRQLVRGSGQQQTDVGNCSNGDQAVAGAVQKALRQSAEEYAYRVINSLNIK